MGKTVMKMENEDRFFQYLYLVMVFIVAGMAFVTEPPRNIEIEKKLYRFCQDSDSVFLMKEKYEYIYYSGNDSVGYEYFRVPDEKTRVVYVKMKQARIHLVVNPLFMHVRNNKLFIKEATIYLPEGSCIPIIECY